MSTKRVAAAGVLGAFLAVAGAAAQTWDGGSPLNSNWSSPANWNPNAVPANDGSADLTFAGNTRRSPVMDADWWVRSITFSSSAGAFSISGTGHKLLIGAGGLTNSDADLQSIAVSNVQLASAQTWSATAGPLHVSIADYLYQGGHDLTIAGDFDTTVDGGGLTNGNMTIVKNGGGTLALGLSLVNQNLTINDGVVMLGGLVEVGSGISTTWRVGLGSTLDLNSVSTRVGQLLELGQVINNNQFLVLGGDDSSYTLSAHISGSGQIMKDGAGTITLGPLFSTTCPELRVAEGTLTLNGRISSDVIEVDLDTSGTISLGSAAAKFGSLSGSGTINTDGQELTVGGAGLDAAFAGDIQGAGELTKKGSGRLNLNGIASGYGGGTEIQSGVLLANGLFGSVTGSGTVRVRAGASLGGGGRVGGAVTVDPAGRLAPGGTESLVSDAGKLELSSACTFAPGSFFEVEIGGHTAGTDFDQVAVSGLATLTDARLSVSFVGGFVPAVGDSFTVLTCGSRTGMFSPGAMPAGFRIRAVAGPAIQVRYDCPGDVDNNRVVNQDDIDAVLFNYGRAVEPGRDGDLDFNGVVNQDDIDTVLYYYGQSCP